MPRQDPRLVSVVVPLFNEEENLGDLHRRLTAALALLGLEYELVLVDDGSRDRTPLLLDELAESDRRVVVVRLSRNFGHQPAICAGLDQAQGDVVFLMDGDLQDPPEVLGDFLAQWRAGNEVVYAIRTRRKEGLLKRVGYFLFYRLLRKVSDLDIPLDSGDFCLLDRRVVDALRALPERQRFVRGLRTFVGFRQTGLPYERQARAGGKPKYTLRALLRLAVDGLVSFSSVPLSLITYLGLASAVVSLGLTAWVFGSALWNQTTPAGWASTMMVVLFLGSVQLISLGIIGEYVRRIFIEVKGRPTYVLSEIRRSGPPEDARRAAYHRALRRWYDLDPKATAVD